MLLKFANNITSFFISKGFLQQNKYDWYVYTIQRRVSSIGGSIILLIAGFIFLGFVETIVLLQSISFIKRRSSGYHATSMSKCWTLSLLTLFANSIIINYIPINTFSSTIFLFVLLICNIIIFQFAPINHLNMNLSKKAILANKIKVRKIVIVESIFALLLYLTFPNEKYMICCVLGILTAALSVILAKLIKQEIKHE